MSPMRSLSGPPEGERLEKQDDANSQLPFLRSRGFGSWELGVGSWELTSSVFFGRLLHHRRHSTK